jgi:large subunit ribosomal protein L33
VGRCVGGAEAFEGRIMAKASKREWVWLQCSETSDLNYRIQINLSQGVPEKLKAGLKKYSKNLRRHTLHKIKRK